MNTGKDKKVNLIKLLIRSKGFTIRGVADEIGIGYHTLQKTIIGAPRVAVGGIVRIHENHEAREKLAAWFGYPFGLVWGPDADFFLKKMIAEEARRRVEINTVTRLNRLGIKVFTTT